MKYLKKITLLLFISNLNLYASSIVGTLETYSTTLIKSEISGTIEHIKYDIGDRVKKGESIIKINDIDYNLAYKMAKANEELSKINYEFLKNDFERYNNLLKTKSITKQTHADRKNAYQVAKLENQISSISLSQAKRELSKTNINAVYSGIVSNRFVEVGDFVSSGDNLLEFVDDSKLKAIFYILQEDYVNFKKGLEVDLVIPDLKNKKLKSKVHLISPTIIGNNSGYRMEIIIDNSKKELKANFEIELMLEKEK